jgi:WSC domain
VQPGTYAGSVTVPAPHVLPLFLTYASIETEIDREVATGEVPTGLGMVYVIMTTGFIPGAPVALGFHGLTPGGHVYAVISQQTPSLTLSVISHELEEIATNFDIASGWYDNTMQEVGDLCANETYQFAGRFSVFSTFTSQKVWSQRNCMCLGASSCGDGRCSPYETASSCPSDCAALRGCFVDAPARTLPTWLGDGHTIESCRAAAANAHLSFAGLENFGECWAGNSVPAPALPDGACNLVCTANSFEGCGAGWALRVFCAAAGTSFCPLSGRCQPDGTTCVAPPVCGDGICAGGQESCSSCPSDCGACPCPKGQSICFCTDECASPALCRKRCSL